MTPNTLLSAKKEAILRIVARHGLHNARVFCSVMRGKADGASDRTLAVERVPRCRAVTL